MSSDRESPPSLRRRLLKASALLTAGRVLGQVFALGRTAIIARLISVAEMGVGRSFGLTTMLLEAATRLAPESMIVQAHDGEDPRLQGVGHLIQVLRGLVMSTSVFVLAKPITILFELPDALWAFQMLALVPFIESFMHLDVKRLERQYNYTPMVVANSGSQFMVLLLAWPLGVWLGDYSVVLWLLVIKAAILVIISHVLAERRYRLIWDRAFMSRFLHFGWPLLLNGLLICVIQQGDHMILGASYGMAQLGVYANAFLLTMMPTRVLANVGRSVTLPLLSQAQDDPELYASRYQRTIEIVSLLALGLGVTFIVMGGQLSGLVFGAEYGAASPYIGWLAALAVARLIRVAPTQAAMARMDTRNALIANIWSLPGLAGMGATVYFGGAIAWIAFFAFFGQACALVRGLVRLKSRQGVRLSVSLRAISIPVLACLTSALVVWFDLGSSWPAAIALTGVIALVYTGLGIWLFGLVPELRDLVSSSWGRLVGSSAAEVSGGKRQ